LLSTWLLLAEAAVETAPVVEVVLVDCLQVFQALHLVLHTQ
jgi:hypothetical protein